jgi:hypothetical protein
MVFALVDVCGLEWTDKELAWELGVATNTVSKARTRVGADKSYDGRVRNRPKSRTREDRRQEVIYLRDVERLTFPEIGKRFGCTRQATHQLYRAAKAKQEELVDTAKLDVLFSGEVDDAGNHLIAQITYKAGEAPDEQEQAETEPDGPERDGAGAADPAPEAQEDGAHEVEAPATPAVVPPTAPEQPTHDLLDPDPFGDWLDP